MRESSHLVKPAGELAVVPSSEPVPVVLPQLPTPLFGRENDLRGINVLLSRDDVRLITFTGAPGIGKTRLSIAVCEDWQRSAGNSAHFVQLGSIGDPTLLLPTIALELNVKRPPEVPLVERVAASLRGRNALLVLDNFEHMLAASGDVVDLLLRTSDLKIIVTSRSALRVRGEHEWNVLPLHLPLAQDSAHLEMLEVNPSVALLLDRTRVGRAGIVLRAENAAAISAICVRLEGIPLAIELAAPWLRLFPPDVMLERLTNRLDFLRGGARDLPDRHRTLADAIGWSDNLLEKEEQRVFHRLAVFIDGWTIAAANTVCCDDQRVVGTHHVVECLSSLLEKSLIHRTTDLDGTPRFSMLEMVREFALQRLEEDEEAVGVQERHATYFQSFIHAAVPHLYREDQAVWLERLERDIGNVRAALRWCIDRGKKLDALQLAAGLENFWLVHDHLGEGQRWLEESLGLDAGSYPTSEANARRVLATLLMRCGEYDRAERLHTRNLTFSQETGDEELCAQALLDLGSLHFIAGDLRQALQHFDRTLKLGERVRDQRTIARALNQLGEIERFGRADDAAALHYEESLAIWRQLAERERIAMVLHNLAPVVARLGDRQRAIALFRESLITSWELRHLHGLALCLVGIAGMVDPQSDALTAAQLLGAADAYREAIGVQWQPVDRVEFERSVRQVAGYLHDEAFAKALDVGRALEPSRAVKLAMTTLDVKQKLLTGGGVRRGERHVRGGLSRREYEIVQHAARGLTNREIANGLNISDKTVEMHLSNALRKLGFRSRSQLAAWLAIHRRHDDVYVDVPPSTAAYALDTGKNTGNPPIF